MLPYTPKAASTGGTSQWAVRPPSSMAWYTALWQLRAAKISLPRGASARMPANSPTVLPFTRYQLRAAPHSAAVRFIASARIPSASCRSSVAAVSVVSHAAQSSPAAGCIRRLCPGMCRG